MNVLETSFTAIVSSTTTYTTGTTYLSKSNFDELLLVYMYDHCFINEIK